MFKKHPLKLRFTVFILLPIIILLIFANNYLRKSLPQIDGSVTVKGVSQPVVISRDEHGVVYIDAKTDNDAYFAIGYAHAQDRMWQLELQRRIAQGRLSEVFGINSLSHDVWMRRLELYNIASSSWQALSPEARMSLTAYASGINAWIETAEVLPPEFMALGIEPAPWTPNDSLAWAKIFALNLAGGMREEIRNLIATKNLTNRQMDTIIGKYPQQAPVTVSNVELKTQKSLVSLLQLQIQIEQDLKIGGKYVGSNAWVVAGEHSADGKAVLANDPHLGLQIPSMWYVASLKGDRLESIGMTLVGIPTVVFGRNDSISWGGTAMMADTQDLFIEQINPEQPDEYKRGESWLKFNNRTELIKVKAAFPSQMRSPYKPVEINLKNTEHGPVVTSLNETFEQTVALRWPALDPKDTTYESFFQLNYATDWQSFRKALRFHVAPTLNILYADKSNNIGYQAVGKIPIRANGHGQLPVPGWNDDFAWVSYIPFDQLPQSYNPEKGYIVSANNKIIGSDYPYFISNNWAPPARAQRIEELIQEQISKGEPLTIDYHQQMQADTVDVSVKELLAVFQQHDGKTERQRKAIDLIKNWQGDMAVNSASAAIFFTWAKHLRAQLFSDELKGFWNKQDESKSLSAMVFSTSYMDVYTALNDKTLNWCDIRGSEAVEGCDYLLTSSLRQALDEIDDLLGADMDSWQWGDMHATKYSHTPFSLVELLDYIVGREIPNGGSTNTINVANSIFEESEGYQQTFGAGFRQIIQFNENDSQHWYMNSTGQSGNVFSRHYADMVEPFNAVQFFELPLRVQTEAGFVLQLQPE